jgi:hypothetical protein
VIGDAGLDNHASTREFIGGGSALRSRSSWSTWCPATEVSLHKHTYPENFIVQEGNVTYRGPEEPLHWRRPER